MASVAKGLRQWIVVPPLAGSNPVVRPYFGVLAAKYAEIYPRAKFLGIEALIGAAVSSASLKHLS